MLSFKSLSQVRLDRRFRAQPAALSPVEVPNKGGERRPVSLGLDVTVTLPVPANRVLLTITPSY